MATLSASPEVVRPSVRWPVLLAPAPTAPPTAAPGARPTGAAEDVVAWRLLAAILAVFVATLALSGVLARAAGSAASLASNRPAAAPVETAAYPAYTVVTGDTLWSIAQRTAPQSDPRATLDEIRTVNGMSAEHVLQPGDVLLVPAGR